MNSNKIADWLGMELTDFGYALNGNDCILFNPDISEWCRSVKTDKDVIDWLSAPMGELAMMDKLGADHGRIEFATPTECVDLWEVIILD